MILFLLLSGLLHRVHDGSKNLSAPSHQCLSVVYVPLKPPNQLELLAPSPGTCSLYLPHSPHMSGTTYINVIIETGKHTHTHTHTQTCDGEFSATI